MKKKHKQTPQQPCENCVDLKTELTRLQQNYDRLEAYYTRTDSALTSLMQDVVNCLSNTNTSFGHIPPSSIFGGQFVEALGKADRLLHGKKV